MNIIGIIPARGGSKGLKGKNIRKLCGKPLIAYTIESAISCRGFDRIFVSTDSPEIAEIAISYGAEVPFLRPQNLALDRSLIGDAVDHLLEKLRLQGYFVNAFATMYPTHPFRPKGLMDLLVSKLREGFNPVLTVRPLQYEPYSIFSVHDDGALKVRSPFGDSEFNDEIKFQRSYGLFSGSTIGAPYMPYLHEINTPEHLVDIDYQEDFLFAQEIIKCGLVAGDLS